MSSIFKEIPTDQVAYLACLLLSFPLSQIYWKYLLPLPHHQFLKQAYFFGFGHLYIFLLLFFPYRSSFNPWSLIHIYIPVLVTYASCYLFRGKSWTPYGVFAFLLGHLTWMHWCRYRWQYGQYNLDHITIVMILTMKLTSFAFDFSDSYIINRSSSDKKGKSAGEILDFLSPEQIKRLSIIHGHYPNLFEFLSYCFMYLGVLTGPAVFYPEYKSFLDGSFFLPPTSSKEDVHELAVIDKSVLKGRKRRATSLFFQAMFFIACNITLKDLYKSKFLITPEFSQLIWLKKIFYLHMINFAWRTKYYLAWLLAEAAHVLIGLGYKATIFRNPENNLDRVVHYWDRYEVVDPVKVESSINFKSVLSEWHKTTNIWLYYYVYKRCGFVNVQRKKPGFRANLITKLVSACWHGIYPGYYITFITAALYTFLIQLIYRNLSWPEYFDSRTRATVGCISNHIVTDYVIAFFELWALKDSLTFLKNTYMYGHIIIIGGIISILFIIKPIKNKRLKSKHD